MPRRCQSLAATLPPELLKLIFKFTQEPKTTTESALANQRNTHAQNAVCAAWRGVSDATHDYTIDGVRAINRLRATFEADPAQAGLVRSVTARLDQAAWTEFLPAAVARTLAGLVRSCNGLRRLTLDLAPLNPAIRLALSWLELGHVDLALGSCSGLTHLRILQRAQISVVDLAR